MVLEWIANPSALERGLLSSSLSRSAKFKDVNSKFYTLNF